MKFYRNEQIEQLAENRLLEYESQMGKPLAPPIDIELFGDLVLGLSMLWEAIAEYPGEEILAGLRAQTRHIVMNENRRDEMEAKPGRRRLTQGHEMGHWDLFVDQSRLDHPVLVAIASPDSFAYRSSTGGQVQIIKTLMSCDEGREILRRINARADAPDEARSVNRYAAALLMPRNLIREAAAKIDRTKWRNLYSLADRFQVTPTALRVRLEQLNLLYFDTRTNTLYRSRDEAHGQAQLF